MDKLILWLLGSLLIASGGVLISLAPRLWRAIQRADFGPYLWLLISIEIHATGVLVAALGRLMLSLPISALGFALLLVSKELWQWPGGGRGRVLFAVQAVAIAAWGGWVLWGL